MASRWKKNKQPKQRVAKKARTQSKNQLEKVLRNANKSNTNATVTRNELQEAVYQDMKKRRSSKTTEKFLSLQKFHEKKHLNEFTEEYISVLEVVALIRLN